MDTPWPAANVLCTLRDRLWRARAGSGGGIGAQASALRCASVTWVASLATSSLIAHMATPCNTMRRSFSPPSARRAALEGEMALRRSPPSSMPSTSVRRSCAVHFVSPKATITRGVNVALRRRVATDNAACGAREHAAASRPATVAATRTARTTPLGMGVWHWGLFVAAPIRHSGDAEAGTAEAGAPAPVLGLTLPHAWRNTWDNQRGRRALGKDVRAHEEGLWTGSGVGVGSGVPGDSSPHFTRWDDTCLNDSLARAAPDPQLPARGRRKALRVPRPFLPVAIVANNNLGRGTWTVGVPHNLRPWDKRVVCANQLTFLMPMQVVHKVQVIASVTIGMYEADISIVTRSNGGGRQRERASCMHMGKRSTIQSLERRAGGWRFYSGNDTFVSPSRSADFTR